MWQNLVAREQTINNVISAYAIITSFKKIIHINLSDANTNVFIVFFTARHVSQLVNVSGDRFLLEVWHSWHAFLEASCDWMLVEQKVPELPVSLPP